MIYRGNRMIFPAVLNVFTGGRVCLRVVSTVRKSSDLFVVLTVCLVLGHTGRFLTEAAFVFSGGKNRPKTIFKKLSKRLNVSRPAASFPM